MKIGRPEVAVPPVELIGVRTMYVCVRFGVTGLAVDVSNWKLFPARIKS